MTRPEDPARGRPDPRSRFDRVRPRDAATAGLGAQPVSRPAPVEATRALFSTGESTPARGSAVVTCRRCGQRSVLSVLRAGRAVLPALWLPVLGGRFSVWGRCPSCRHQSRLRIRVRL